MGKKILLLACLWCVAARLNAQCDALLRQTIGSALALHRDSNATLAFRLADSAWRTQPSPEIFGRLCEAAYLRTHWVGDSLYGNAQMLLLGEMSHRIAATALSPNAQWAVAGDVMGEVWLWNIVAAKHYPLGNMGEGTVALAFSPDAQHVLGIFRDNSFRVWSVALGADFGKERTLGAGNSTAINGCVWLDARRFAIAEGSGKYIPSRQLMEVFSIDGEQLLRIECGENRVERIGYQSDSSLLTAFCADSVVRRYTLRGVLKDSFAVADFRQQYPLDAQPFFLKKENTQFSRCHSAAFPIPLLNVPFGTGISDNVAPNGDYATFLGNIVSIRNAQGRELLTLSAHEDLVSAVRFVPLVNGYEILTSAMDKQVRRWAQSGALRQTYRETKGNYNFIPRAALSPDGKWLIAATGYSSSAPRASDGIIWNTQTGEKVAEMMGHEANMLHLSFSPDGKTILTSAEDGTARLWTLKGEEIRTIDDHRGAVASAFFFPDGRMFTASQTEGNLRNARGDVLVRIREPFIQAAVYSSVYKVLFTASASGVIAWDERGTRLFSLPCTQATRLLLAPNSEWLLSSSFEGVMQWDFSRLTRR